MRRLVRRLSTLSLVDTPIKSLPNAWREPFTLDREFVRSYSRVLPVFGFNGLGELVYKRTYSRRKPDGSFEEWFETVERVVNGTFNMQRRWFLGELDSHEPSHPEKWDPTIAQYYAQKMYEKIFQMKFLPPGRGLWAMGSSLTEHRSLFAALNNCAFIGTEQLGDLDVAPSKVFGFLMDASMLGVGVGFDTKGAGKRMVRGIDVSIPEAVVMIHDSREGWVDALCRKIDSYFVSGIGRQVFDFSEIRPAGQPIHGFGGVSSGPQALEVLLGEVEQVLESHVGKPLSATGIVDIMNYIGKCVVAGNVRRTAEIAFGDPYSEEYLDLKNYSKNPQRMSHGWASNNSVFAELGMEYSKICDRIRDNGEPGLAWLENMRAYGRMSEAPNFKDANAQGGNPCLEQTLESHELCCLVETFPEKHTSLEDYLDTLDYAMMYAKTVTLGPMHWPKSQEVLKKNRRIGCSMSGIAQFISKRGIHELRNWCEAGYQRVQKQDAYLSKLFGVTPSIKLTSIKPSGTVSLLAGATPGMHYPESRFYIRRVRIAANSELLHPLRKAGYTIEPAHGQPDTMVVEIPIDAGKGIRTVRDVSIWEQLSLASFLQECWADNQVSCTATFNPQTEAHQLEHALNYFQYRLKGISFLPITEKGAFPQMPYEEISEQEYERRKVRTYIILNLTIMLVGFDRRQLFVFSFVKEPS